MPKNETYKDATQASLKLFDAFYKSFQKHSKLAGLHYSISREYLLKVLFFSDEYLSVQEIVQKIAHSFDKKISLTTIYKILHTLETITLVTTLLKNPDKTKKYKLNAMLHYDHLVCTHCSKIIQFHSVEIEQIQSEILDQNHFIGIGHTMILYGVCQNCQEAHLAK